MTFSSISRALALATILVILLWVLSKIISALLLLVFALVLIIIINAPVAKLEKRGMKRGWACLIVFSCIFIALSAMIWLIIPRISQQLNELIANLPGYIDTLSKRSSEWLSAVPLVDGKLDQESLNLKDELPSVTEAISKITSLSFSFFGSIVVFIIFASIIVYGVINPGPLFEIYFLWFPKDKRETALRAFQEASVMLRGWFKANLIGGSIEAVLTSITLSLLNVPGALVWGVLALFAELIPKIGFYLMAVPPILVAFSVSPMTALWTTVFFLALNEIMADFIMPRLRSSTMSIHPVSTLFMVLAMAGAFGLMGALLATPMAAIIKAYYYAFYVKNQDKEKLLQNQIDQAVSFSPEK